MYNSTNSQQKHGRHSACFDATNNAQTTANVASSTWSGEFKHPGRCSRAPFSRDPILNKRHSPTARSESDKSSPPEVFSPASSATSSASSLSSDSASNTVSPTPSSSSWTASSVNAPGPDCFLPRSFSQVSQDLSTSKSHPRRTAVSSSWVRPSLVRQEQRRQHLVEQLVGKLLGQNVNSNKITADIQVYNIDSATQLVALIWPTANAMTSFPNKVISLRFYIRETLRRSRTSYSTLQVTLWYLMLIRPYVAAASPSASNQDDGHDKGSEEQQVKADGPSCALQCGRRMFLSALILASKYLQDRNFTARAWSKITGLPAKEIVSNESVFLAKVSWNLHMKEGDFRHWNAIILSCTSPMGVGQSLQDTWMQVLNWVHEGLSLEGIAENLSVKRQSSRSCSEFGTYNQLSTLFAPNMSFTSSSEALLVTDSAPASVSGVKASPAISVASDSSTLSSFSSTEVRAPATRYGDPAVRRPGDSAWYKRGVGQLLTPSASFDGGRCDDEGQPTGHSSHASHASVSATWFGMGGVADSRPLVNTCGNISSIPNPPCGADVDNGMRAPAQQLVSTPLRSTENAASWLDGPNCGLPQRSIAHASLKQPSATCGLKRAASSMLTKLTLLEDMVADRDTKFRCTNGLQSL